MKQAETAYGRQRAHSWARVDMLLALYQSGIQSTESAIEATKNNQEMEANRHRIKAMRVIQGLAAGLDMNDQQIVPQIARLCEFVNYALQEGTIQKLEAGKNVLETLRSAFESIRDDAVLMEEQGEIPLVDQEGTVKITV